MKLMTSVVFGLLLLLLFLASSCNRYIDKVTSGEREVQIMQGNITFYPDSNVLNYRSSVGLRMDSEILKPKPFYVKLPKGLKCYEMANSQSFVFYYSHQQIVAININLSDRAFMGDTMYEPTKAELDSFLNRSTLGHGKYGVRKIKSNSQRKQCFIKKEAATILLYNITSGNFSEFSECLERVRFL
jgi:hypothetical protein